MPSSPIEPTEVPTTMKSLFCGSHQHDNWLQRLLNVLSRCTRNNMINQAQPPLKIGDMILIQFPHEETGAQRKLFSPWHGPYRIHKLDDTGIAARVYH